MRHTILAFALLGLVASASLAREPETTEHVTQTLPLAPGGALRLKSFSGAIHISASDRPEVVIDAVRYGTRERLDRIKLRIYPDGPNTIVVDANSRERSWMEFSGRDNVVKTDFEITVPRRANLDLSVFSAPVTVVGVEGEFNSFSGHLNSERPLVLRSGNRRSLHAELGHAGDGSGRLKFKTFSGNVKIDR